MDNQTNEIKNEVKVEKKIKLNGNSQKNVLNQIQTSQILKENSKISVNTRRRTAAMSNTDNTQQQATTSNSSFNFFSNNDDLYEV